MIWRKRTERVFAAVSARLANRVRPSVVFMGDSITEFWSAADPGLFRPVRFNAGIAGNTTTQMWARFATDVVARRPRVVHIMGGTNDLWFGAPGEEASASLANIMAMAEMARRAGIAVVLAQVPPIGRVAQHLFAHPDSADALRTGITDYAHAEGLTLVDYADVLVRDCDLFGGFTTDGVHLTRAGYRAIRAHAERAIRHALG